jgi:hypothetical protein
MEDKVVAILHLGEELSMLTAGLLTLLIGEEGVKAASHFWPHGSRSRAVSESASSGKRVTLPHGKKALLLC